MAALAMHVLVHVIPRFSAYLHSYYWSYDSYRLLQYNYDNTQSSDIFWQILAFDRPKQFYCSYIIINGEVNDRLYMIVKQMSNQCNFCPYH